MRRWRRSCSASSESACAYPSVSVRSRRASSSGSRGAGSARSASISSNSAGMPRTPQSADYQAAGSRRQGPRGPSSGTMRPRLDDRAGPPNNGGRATSTPGTRTPRARPRLDGGRAGNATREAARAGARRAARLASAHGRPRLRPPDRGDALSEHESSLAPASNEKLAVTYAALAGLDRSSDRDDVVGRGEQDGTGGRGTLLLVGRATRPSRAAARVLGDPIRAAGITRVTGRVLGDERLRLPAHGPGWKRSFYATKRRRSRR